MEYLPLSLNDLLLKISYPIPELIVSLKDFGYFLLDLLRVKLYPLTRDRSLRFEALKCSFD